jgi:hypothetical protein
MRSISKWEIAIRDMTDFQKFQKLIPGTGHPGRGEAV